MRKILLPFLLLFVFACKQEKPAINPGLSTDPQQYGTPYNKVPDAKDATIYQVNMRAFSNDGNLIGVTAKLDHIKSLGINVIYLMPIYPVGVTNSINSPYCIKDYQAVGSEFGNLEDLRALVEEAHKKGMAVILDFVANHTAWDHPWITAHKDWYKQDGSGKIVAPPNFGDVAQLNFANADMRNALVEALRYWAFTTNIDGYRFDFADNVSFDFWKQATTSLRSISGRKFLLFAEGTSPNHMKVGMDLTFGFSFFGRIKDVYANAKSALEINNINKTDYENLIPGARIVRYVTNHDVNLSDGTPVELFNGEKGALSAFVLAAYMKGVPMIYNGQEIGYNKRINYFRKDPINWVPNATLTGQYQKLLEFRNGSNAVKDGEMFVYSSSDVVAFTKQKGSEKVLVLVNLRNKQVEYNCPSDLTNGAWIDVMGAGSVTLTSKVVLGSNGFMILKK